MFSFLKRSKSSSEPPTLYQQIGGETGVRAMSERFYDIMASDPKARELLALHPQPLGPIREKFYEFLSGWLGGPPLFEQKYGHPRLRARHMPFQIDIKMRDQWLYCMYQVLDEQINDPLIKMQLRQRFTALAHHMINSA